MLPILLVSSFLISFLFASLNSDWTAANDTTSGYHLKGQFFRCSFECTLYKLEYCYKVKWGIKMPTNSFSGGVSLPSFRASSTPRHAETVSTITVKSSESDDGSLKGEHQVGNAMDCAHCLRKGGPIFCHLCGFWIAQGRIAKPCQSHPKVIFYTDFKACPKCKRTEYLRELD